MSYIRIKQHVTYTRIYSCITMLSTKEEPEKSITEELTYIQGDDNRRCVFGQKRYLTLQKIISFRTVLN